MNYETRKKAIIVNRRGEPMFSEMATTVEIEDELAGEFVIVSQENGSIRISPEEWDCLRTAINEMIDCCREQAK